jgi:carbon-monoxide dehydrogenase large subunit
MVMPDASGGAVRRREDPRLLKGEGRYTGDLRFPGLAHAALVRSPHAHAAVGTVDVAAAKAAPGILGVFTAADLAADGMPELPCGVDMKRPDGSKAPQTTRPLLARDRVRHVGEPVALIVGETLEAALDAAELVEVAYDPLPSASNTADGLQGKAVLWPEAPDNIAWVWSKGIDDALDAALQGAAHVTRLDFAVSRVSANPIEPRVALGQVEDGRLVLHVSHQSPYGLRNGLAALFKLPPGQVRVVAGDVGGSFGMKAGAKPEDVLVLWAARKLGRPVLWRSSRGEAFVSDDHARDVLIRAELGLDKDGKFLALKVRQDVNIGCYLSGRSLGTLNNIGGITGVYRIGRSGAVAHGVFSNTLPMGPYRGAGRPEATYTIERLIDVAARELGIEPWELRRRNLVPASAMPYDTGFTFKVDCGDFAANMDAAARTAERDGFAARRDEAKRRGKLRGLGIANPIEVAGGPFTKPGKDSGFVNVAPDGTVTVLTGAMSTGQGIETAMAQLVAQRLGVPIERIRYGQGDTDQLPAGRGSGGSSALCVGGTAVSLAIDKVLEKGRALAADLLEAAAIDIAFADGRFTVSGTDRSVALVEVARLAAERAASDPEAALAAGEEWQPPSVTFPNGCHICEVEVDPETGAVEIVRYSAVEDVGRVLNPMLVAGQMHGGVMQGIGQVLGERILHDPETGQMLTASFMDYFMPRADDLLRIDVATREVPTAVNPLGAKGVGEAGTVGALSAAMNAICDALAPLGVRHLDMPATPERVWAAIQAAGGRA